MKRQINISNYESFFLDYIDGNLSSEEISMLENFLVVNPGLRDELEGLEEVQLLKDDPEFLNRENLKHIDLSMPIHEDNFKYFCIASLEGDLSDGQQAVLNDYLKRYPEKKTELEDYEKTILFSSQEIFENKSILKRNIFVIIKKEVLVAIAVAAGFALLFVLFGLPRIVVTKELAFDENASLRYEEVAKEKTDSIQVKGIKTQSDPDELPSAKIKNPAINYKSNTHSKVSIPIAEIKETRDDKFISGSFDTAAVLAQIRIDPDMFNRNVAALDKVIKNDVIEGISIKPVEPQIGFIEQLASENLQEYGRQKLSSFVFKNDSDRDFSLWSVASAGIEKINKLTGSEMKLERSIDPEGNTDGVKFDSRALSISTPLK